MLGIILNVIFGSAVMAQQNSKPKKQVTHKEYMTCVKGTRYSKKHKVCLCIGSKAIVTRDRYGRKKTDFSHAYVSGKCYKWIKQPCGSSSECYPGLVCDKGFKNCKGNKRCLKRFGDNSKDSCIPAKQLSYWKQNMLIQKLKKQQRIWVRCMPLGTKGSHQRIPDKCPNKGAFANYDNIAALKKVAKMYYDFEQKGYDAEAVSVGVADGNDFKDRVKSFYTLSKGGRANLRIAMMRGTVGATRLQKVGRSEYGIEIDVKSRRRMIKKKDKVGSWRGAYFYFRLTKVKVEPQEPHFPGHPGGFSRYERIETIKLQPSPAQRLVEWYWLKVFLGMPFELYVANFRQSKHPVGLKLQLEVQLNIAWFFVRGGLNAGPNLYGRTVDFGFNIELGVDLGRDYYFSLGFYTNNVGIKNIDIRDAKVLHYTGTATLYKAWFPKESPHGFALGLKLGAGVIRYAIDGNPTSKFEPFILQFFAGYVARAVPQFKKD